MNYMKAAPICWCGNTSIDKFSDDYSKCDLCGTLVVSQMPQIEMPDEREQGLYGREYWFSHQEQDYGHNNITKRAREDLSERCLYWLNVLLKYRLPPASTLELGCAHGGFVALLKFMGFNSSGLEISPAIVEYAQNSFGIEVLCGSIEKQKIEANSLDVIVMMDVLEHLQDPVKTLEHCIAALKNDGILIIQTPRYEENRTYDSLKANEEPFLKLLRSEEHLYLFSQRSVNELLKRAGFLYVEFEPAIFSYYDMFLIASREPLIVNTHDKIEEVLSNNAQTRFVQALLDMFEKNNELTQQLQQIEMDSAMRLNDVNKLTALLKESESDRAARLEAINRLEQQIQESSHEQLAGKLKETQEQLQVAEKDRAARLCDLNKLTTLLKSSEEDRVAQSRVISELKEKLNKKMANKNVRGHFATTIAIDLTPILPDGENGGAKIVAIELIRALSKIAPTFNFILLTTPLNHEELAVLDAKNVSRICVVGSSNGEVVVWKRSLISLLMRFGIIKISFIKKFLSSSIRNKLKHYYYKFICKIEQAKIAEGLIKNLGADLLFCPFTAPFYHDPEIKTVSVILDLQYKYCPQFFSPLEQYSRHKNFESAYSKSDYLVCISDYVRKTVLESCSRNPKDVKTIHLCLGSRLPNVDEKQRMTILRKLNLDDGEFLLYPANFWKHKNHEMLFTAYGMFRARNKKSKIKLVCTGALEGRKKYLHNVSIKMGLEDCIVMPGYIANEEFAALLLSCKAVVFPSLYEGFGMPVIEAMHHKKPVLCSNVTSLPEIAGEAALFFDPYKPDEICQAMECLEQQPQCVQKIIGLGFEQAKKFSDPIVMAHNYLEVFNEALTCKHEPSYV